VSILIDIGENNATPNSEDDVAILSELDANVDEMEPEEIKEILDDELPDIDFEE